MSKQQHTPPKASSKKKLSSRRKEEEAACSNDNNNRDKNPLKPLDKDRRDTQRLLWVSKSNNPQGPKADSRETYK